MRIVFLHNSTGYIQGSIPPRFSRAHVKPVPMLGSDGSYTPDRGLSTWSILNEARDRAKSKPYCVGFELWQENGYAGHNVLHRETWND